jgi:hypothetical protein
MNKLLVRKKSFAPNGSVLSDMTFNQSVIDEKKNQIFSIANSKRGDGFTPIFVSDPKVLPVTDTMATSDSSPVVEDVILEDVSDMTMPPQKQSLSDFQKGVIVAVAAVLIIKLLS